MSESEGEEMAGQEVTLPQDLPGRGNTQSTQSAVKLTEVVDYTSVVLKLVLPRPLSPSPPPASSFLFLSSWVPG